MLPGPVFVALEELLLAIGDIHMTLSSIENVMSRCLPIMLPQFSRQFISKYLQIAHRAINTMHVTANVSASSRLTIVTRAMVKNVDRLNREHLAAVFEPNGVDLGGLVSDIGRKLTRWAKQSSSESTSTAIHELAESLRNFVLAVVLLGASHGLHLQSVLVLDLLTIETNNYTTLSRGLPPCQVPTQDLKLGTLQLSQDLPWEESLRHELTVRAQADHTIISAAIHQVCSSLEKRCQDVETPLRAEQNKVAELENRCHEMEDAWSHLESELMNRDLHIADLETEAQRQSSDMQQEREMLHGRIDEMQCRYEKALSNAHSGFRQEKSAYEAEMVALSSENARLSEDLEQSKNAAHSADLEIESLTTMLKDVKERLQHQTVEVQTFKLAKVELETRCADHEQSICRLQEQLRDLHQTQGKARQELEMQRTKNIEANNKTEDVLTDLRELRKVYEKEREDFLTEFRENAAHARDELESARSGFEEQIKTLEDQLHEADNAADEALRLNEERSRHHKRQIAQLKKECAARDRELRAAQEMRNKLMTAMGIAAPAPPPEIAVSTLPIRSASSTATPSARANAQQYDETDLLDDSMASALAEKLEPTPKRSKGRVGFKMASQHPARDSSMARASGGDGASAAAQSRIPLSETNANIPPTRKTPGKVAFKDVQGGKPDQQDLRLMEGWSFSTDVVASTPAIGLLGGEHVNDDVDDDTTVDL